MTMVLHGYFRSTASWRVRIALGLKGLGYESVSHHLRKGQQRAAEYLEINPQGLVPALDLGGGHVLTQSLAICEYLDELHPEPGLLPLDALDRAQVRAFAQVIACDVHPVQNLKILNRLREFGIDDAGVNNWARATIEEGLEACERLVSERRQGPFCFGNLPGLADICLVPQLGNARRFGAALNCPRLLEIEAACLELPAFKTATPENQPDAE